MWRLCHGKSAYSIFNFDATHYKLSPNGNLKVIFVKDEEAEDLPATIEGKSALPLTIKLLHLHCAGGYPASPVFIISDPNVDENDFVAEKIVGLSNTLHGGSSGWLIFMKSRAGNTRFYAWWYLREVIIDYVNLCRTHYVVKLKYNVIITIS